LSKLTRILLIILVILAVATALLWFKPDLLSSLSALNPFGGERKVAITPTSTPGSPTAQVSPAGQTTTATPPRADTSNVGTADTAGLKEEEKEEKEEILSPFEKEIQQRYESYQTKIYTYEPYQPPVMRNPFQRVVSTVYVSEEEEQLAEELSSEEAIRRFVQPELPPGSKYTGMISSGDMKLAILEMEDETYIAKEGDLILDKYLIKHIQDDEVIIEINDYEIPLKLGGEEVTNE